MSSSMSYNRQGSSSAFQRTSAAGGVRTSGAPGASGSVAPNPDILEFDFKYVTGRGASEKAEEFHVNLTDMVTMNDGSPVEGPKRGSVESATKRSSQNDKDNALNADVKQPSVDKKATGSSEYKGTGSINHAKGGLNLGEGLSQRPEGSQSLNMRSSLQTPMGRRGSNAKLFDHKMVTIDPMFAEICYTGGRSTQAFLQTCQTKGVNGLDIEQLKDVCAWYITRKHPELPMVPPQMLKFENGKKEPVPNPKKPMIGKGSALYSDFYRGNKEFRVKVEKMTRYADKIDKELIAEMKKQLTAEKSGDTGAGSLGFAGASRNSGSKEFDFLHQRECRVMAYHCDDSMTNPMFFKMNVFSEVKMEELNFFKFASENLRADKASAKMCVKKDGLLLKYVTGDAQKDEGICTEALKQNKEAIRYVPDVLRIENKDFAKKCEEEFGINEKARINARRSLVTAM